MDTPVWDHQSRSADAPGAVFVLPLAALDHTSLAVAGGKAANLGELIRAGFPVPEGFCLTTAAYASACDTSQLAALLAELAAIGSDERTRQAELAATMRAVITDAPLPLAVNEALTEAYLALVQEQPVAVAVRSSATAEDLPSASFAGQQETFLNLIGVEAVLAAVRQCWASLWTDRAVSYRASLGIDPRTVRLAVVVQRMVNASVAGVLFTANPLTGRRREAVIDANPGLGEAVVSGATNPDHFVVRTSTGEIVERRLGDKRFSIQPVAGGGIRRVENAEAQPEACLTEMGIRALVKLGAAVEKQFACPQDLEWAMDAAGQILLLQTRPITTLFPLPVDAPTTDDELRVYLSFTVQQGTYRPFTPMGISAIRVLASSISALVGYPPRSMLAGPHFVTEAASRVYFDVTAALRSSFGRALLVQSMEQAEVHAATMFRQLANDPCFALRPTPRGPLFRAIARLLVRSGSLWHLVQAMVSPGSARARFSRLIRELQKMGTIETNRPAADYLTKVEQLLVESMRWLPGASFPVMMGGMQTLALAKTLLGEQATESELQVALRGSPFNPTTEMNLALWTLAGQVRADRSVSQQVRGRTPAQLAEAYRGGRLPALLQRGLADFLAQHGHRSVSELDLGVPRWSEDPAYVLTILCGYLESREPALSPATQYRQAAREGEAMVAELTRRARLRSRWRGLIAGFCLRRARALGGLREMPRFVIALLLAQARTMLWPAGEELARLGRLDAASDIFFLTLPEGQEALAGTDMRARVRERRAADDQERARRHVPLVLLSDGTEPSVEPPAAAVSPQQRLQGTPASPGVVTATARVILDPRGADLLPGEILVAPSTDPGWTPLFLTAGGLVMETGGAMAHGAIVAREYGIPAVVGVRGAIECIPSGSRITVDGAAGTVSIEQCVDGE